MAGCKVRGRLLCPLKSKFFSISDRQLSKGRGPCRFKDEGYIRNLMFNEISPVSEVGAFRCICLPSMKGGYYIVHAVAEKTTGDITEDHCHCPAGLSRTCQHVVGLLLAVVGALAEPEPTCTDLPCAGIVPSSAKRWKWPSPSVTSLSRQPILMEGKASSARGHTTLAPMESHPMLAASEGSCKMSFLVHCGSDTTKKQPNSLQFPSKQMKTCSPLQRSHQHTRVSQLSRT
ncbi:uncharacterized protein LOC144094034 isoform X2 [Amblyomma americanum]